MDVWTLKLPMLIFTVSCLKLFTEDIWNPRSPMWIFTVLFANFHEGCLKPQVNNADLHCMFLPLNHQCWSLMCIFLCFHYVFLKPCHHSWLLSWWLCRMNRFLSSIRNDFNYQHHLCVKNWQKMQMYPQTSDIRHTLVGNKIVDHPDVVWSIACWRCSNYIFILDLTLGFNGLSRDNCKTRWEIFKCWDLVWLILEVWQYFSFS